MTMQKSIEQQKREGAILAGFFLSLTEDFDEGVFLGSIGAILVAKAGGAKEAFELVAKLGAALVSAEHEGVM